MMIIEAMKKLRRLEKRMQSNTEDISRYSSMVSTERPYFESEDEQRRQVAGLVQSNLDLMKEYLILKRGIEYTNLMTNVTMGDHCWSISEMLVIKRKLSNMMLSTYRALNDTAGTQRLRHAAGGGEKQPHVVRLYHENVRNEGMRMWSDLYHEIDSRLEVVNATTELLSME